MNDNEWILFSKDVDISVVSLGFNACQFLWVKSIFIQINRSISNKSVWNHHHHVAPSARISMSLSRHPSLSSIASGRSSGIHPASALKLLYVSSSWSSCLCLSMWRGPQVYITYEFVLTSPAVSRMSGSSNFDSFRNGW